MPFVRRKRGQALVVHSQRTAAGKVEQLVLARLSSLVEIELVVAEPEWSSWTATLRWRYPDLDWDWDRIRRGLRAAGEALREQPAGAIPRNLGHVKILAGSLQSALRPLSPSHPSHGSLLAEVRPELEALRAELDRLLPAKGGSAPRHDQTHVPKETAPAGALAPVAEADAAFERGMDRWWKDDRAGACAHFRMALSLDPLHADAHNHLGIQALETGDREEAEAHYRAAIEGGERKLVRDGRRVEWGRLENRPYLRGLGNLAIALRERGRFKEALDLHLRLLRLNPADDQGVRYLIGEEHHRLGGLELAVKAYRKGSDDAGNCYGLALALSQLGRPAAEIGEALLHGFGLNRYVAPMLLGEPWKRLDGWHGSNLREPEWAADYVHFCRDLWQGVAGSAEWLETWWKAPRVVGWRQELDAAMVALRDLRPGPERTAVVDREYGLLDATCIRDLALQVAADLAGK